MQSFLIGDTNYKPSATDVQGEFTELLGEPFYRIRNYDAMAPFLMSLVSGSDHWMFPSSNGGLTAGRVNAERALFPYYTEDKIRDNSENTGSVTILFATRAGQTHLWEPFSGRRRGLYRIRRNLYKNRIGSAVVFEEENLDLGLVFRYAWRTGERFGFIRTAWLANTGPGACRLDLLDGLQNLLPANAGSQTQNVFSVLLDAYKRAELHAGTGLGIFSLSSQLSDLPEPSESLLATTAAQIGLKPDAHLLSSTQLDAFREGRQIVPETDVRGRRGAYFVQTSFALGQNEETSWYFIADVCRDHAEVVRLLNRLNAPLPKLAEEIEADIVQNNRALLQLAAAADGLQASADLTVTSHHLSNTLFNIMRGGVFPDQYRVKPADIQALLRQKNREAHARTVHFFDGLPEEMPIWALLEAAENEQDAALSSVVRTYLPLTFSRRHGDPSRPWNRFSIFITNPDGARRYGYEGNWRDIFQNWEPLALAFPEYAENMVHTFLNATTVDGYNPYRITHEGIDWEKPEPDNPWSNIGYWSDHQIIYLLKLMEVSRRIHPGRLEAELSRAAFAYANVPYRIKPYDRLVVDPHRTIDFDWELDRELGERVALLGTDANLVTGPGGQILRVTLAEKLLSLLLAKLVNYVPEGGIWMNTQRPEWNDANNALVGTGLSVVTLGYLRRFVVFLRDLLASSRADSVEITGELHGLYEQIESVFSKSAPRAAGHLTGTQRRRMMDELGSAGSTFRWAVYREGLTGRKAVLAVPDLLGFLMNVQVHLEHSLKANRMDRGLYHAYNILDLSDDSAEIGRLDLMLEGQVSILSSGLLTGAEALELVRALRHSELYRANQNSYLLYPDRRLDGFLEKNCIPPERIRALRLFTTLLEAGDHSLITRDESGGYHFNHRFRNERDVTKYLEEMREKPEYAGLVDDEAEEVLALFERVFEHDRFIGRSGTFFAYEGLGSIYWHMVAKLLLAVQENALRYRDSEAGPGLKEAYREIRAGLGFNKIPENYGAFPVDPYSHTPSGRGAQQPGMTGLVKEELLTRQTELGLFVRNGRIAFDFLLFDPEELLQEQMSFRYLDVSGAEQQIMLEPGSLAFTFCQVPVVIRHAQESAISILRKDGSRRVEGHVVDAAHSRHIMQRDGLVERLEVSFQG